ncbi:MAG: PrpR N-terminal domain-containing protein, partial [Oribacterium sp.]|nr:PrpR N-terminal domain-containing protein [Oribacterium sp.]
MANIALLVPNDELFRLTHDVLQEMKKSLFYMKVIETEDAVTEARQVISAGADIIIARGLQATMIKQYTDIPVVEIVATRSGISSILEHGKRIVRKKIPEIAIVMFRNMACDMTGLGDACGVHLREYLIQNPELLKTTARQAVEDKADLIIGGETVCSVADRAGVPSLFLTNTEDAV